MKTLEQPTPDELAVALRDSRPRIDAEFATKLDEKVAAGFPRAEGRRLGLPRPRGLPRLPRAKLLPALAAAASLLIVGAVVTSFGDDTGGGSGERSAIQRERGAGTAASPALGESALPDQTTSLAPASPGDTSAAKRRIERSASLTLTAEPDKVESVADGVIKVTDRYRGFVLNSNVSSGESGQAQASFDLRIPAARLPEALRDLSALAHLKARSQSGQDITAQFVSAQDRLQDARAERRALLQRLAKATSPGEAAAIRQQLRLVRSQIALARGELRSLRGRTNFASLTVAIEASKGGSGGGAWTPGDALGDARRILATALAVALVSLAVLVPFGLIGLAGLLAGRKLTHRRREQALET